MVLICDSRYCLTLRLKWLSMKIKQTGADSSSSLRSCFHVDRMSPKSTFRFTLQRHRTQRHFKGGVRGRAAAAPSPAGDLCLVKLTQRPIH